MTSLYNIKYSAIKECDLPGMKNWQLSNNFFGITSCLVDRSGMITAPLRMKVHPKCHLPELPKNFNKSFEEICLERGRELLRIQTVTRKPLYLMYSGGMDSTATLATFIQLLSESELRDRIIVLLNETSISEYPNFYHRHIKGKIRIVSSELYSHLLGQGATVVNSLLCGWLFGPTQYIQVATELYGFDGVHGAINESKFISVLVASGHSEEAAKYWYGIVCHQITRYKKVEIRTLFEFLWWFVFIFGWQSDYLKVSLRLLPNASTQITDTFFDSQYLDFYASDSFQIWAMLNNHHKLKEGWNTFKWPVKKFIFDFNKDQDYRDNKVKMPSLSRLFHNNRPSLAMTDAYEFINEIDMHSLYLPKNDFV